MGKSWKEFKEEAKKEISRTQQKLEGFDNSMNAIGKGATAAGIQMVKSLFGFMFLVVFVILVVAGLR
jgi:hypothetical protein